MKKKLLTAAGILAVAMAIVAVVTFTVTSLSNHWGELIFPH